MLASRVHTCCPGCGVCSSDFSGCFPRRGACRAAAVNASLVRGGLATSNGTGIGKQGAGLGAKGEDLECVAFNRLGCGQEAAIGTQKRHAKREARERGPVTMRSGVENHRGFEKGFIVMRGKRAAAKYNLQIEVRLEIGGVVGLHALPPDGAAPGVFCNALPATSSTWVGAGGALH